MTETVNELRGEAEIVLGRATYGMRPSYEAIVEIEKATGKTIGVMAVAASNVALPVSTLAIVVAELIKAWGRATKDASAAHVGAGKIGSLIVETSVVAASLGVAKVLTDAVTGGYTASGEAKAAETSTAGLSTAA